MRRLSQLIAIGYILICLATLAGTAIYGPIGYAPFPLPIGPARTPVVVTVWYGTEKEVWLTAAAVLDISGSMNEENRLDNAKAALKTFIQQLSDDDGLGLTTFSSTATVLSPISPLGPKRQQLLDQVGGLFPQGGTRLFDTIDEAYQPLSAEPEGQRIRAVVVLTDGEDNESSMTADALVSQLQRNQEGRSVKVFTIAYGDDTGASADALKRIAQASGAKTYQAGTTGIEQVYRDIATFF